MVTWNIEHGRIILANYKTRAAVRRSNTARLRMLFKCGRRAEMSMPTFLRVLNVILGKVNDLIVRHLIARRKTYISFMSFWADALPASPGMPRRRRYLRLAPHTIRSRQSCSRALAISRLLLQPRPTLHAQTHLRICCVRLPTSTAHCNSSCRKNSSASY